MYKLSLNENKAKFKDLERIIYEFVCRQACEMIIEILKELDEKLMKERDKKKYRNQSISHTEAWNIVQTVGEKIAKKEKKDRYIVKNKKAYASFGGSKDFGEIREAKIAKEYKVDKIQTKIVNGDGAGRIKEIVREDNSHFQLDIFHRNQAVIRNVEDKSKAKKIIKKLSNGKIDEGLKIITELMIENNENEDSMKKLESLYNYIVNNREGIVVYKVRPDINMPEPPKGIKYRNLGTMEHNICDILARRMKGNKTSWSKKGASNLAKILAEKASKELTYTINILLNKGIKKEKLDEIIEDIVLPASNINKKPKKSNIYKHKRSSIPFITVQLQMAEKL